MEVEVVAAVVDVDVLVVLEVLVVVVVEAVVDAIPTQWRVGRRQEPQQPVRRMNASCLEFNCVP